MAHVKSLYALILLFSAAHAQPAARVARQDSVITPRVFIGTYFGRSLVERDSRIDAHHNRFGFLWQWRAKSNYHGLVTIEYYNANGAWGKDLINYKGTTHLFQNVQHLKSMGLNLHLLKPIADQSAVGLGLGLERISTEMTTNKAPFTFCIDETDNIVICNPATETSTFFAPAVSLISDVYHNFSGGFQIFIIPQIKLVHIGNRHHADSLNSWISFTVNLGIRLGL